MFTATEGPTDIPLFSAGVMCKGCGLYSCQSTKNILGTLK